MASSQTTNKISLNVGKTDGDFKIKLTGKRLYEKGTVNYLGIQIDKSLTWKQQINHVAIKLNKVNILCY